uniref:medium-chain acyl-CoA ligase n=1 Tax=Sinocyclocheilus anshuiensis TaxID=1608454 RepID=A0A671LZW9_9TELE
MNVYVLRKSFFNHCLKISKKNEVHEGGQWLQMCRSKTYAPKNFCDYESMRRTYNIRVPQRFNFAKDVLEQWETKEKNGQRSSLPALWWVNDGGEEVRWSFEELGFHSRRLANVLHQECSLERGDRVFLILPRVPEWWLVNVACLRTGTVLIPGTSQLTARDICHRLQTSGAKCVITDETLAPLLDTVASDCPSISTKLLLSHRAMHGWGNLTELMGKVSDDHVCMDTRSEEAMTIFFTSGTTGSPKMTQHSHCSYGLGLSVNGRYWLDLTEQDVFWNTSDTGWAKSAWSSVFAPWIQGACVFVHHMPRFDTSTVLKTLSSYPITTFCTAPTAYRMLVQDDISRFTFRALEHCLCAGEPINPEVMWKWKELTGLDIYEGYGQTETHPAVAESAVVSSPDPVRGEVVKAFVVLTADYKSRDHKELIQELQTHVKTVTAPYKYPRKIEFVDHLPKTVSGKIRRVELRKKEWGQCLPTLMHHI